MNFILATRQVTLIQMYYRGICLAGIIKTNLHELREDEYRPWQINPDPQSSAGVLWSIEPSFIEGVLM